MLIHTFFPRETFVAEFARKPLLIRLNDSFPPSGRVVTLVVRVQLIDAVVVTVADLAHDVASGRHLKSQNIVGDSTLTKIDSSTLKLSIYFIFSIFKQGIWNSIWKKIHPYLKRSLLRFTNTFLCVTFNVRNIWKEFATNVARNCSFVSLSRFYRLTTVHLPLMTEHGLPYRETFLAEFARKPPLFVRLYSTLGRLSPGRVVHLVVRIQLFNAVVVTVADLTHDVATITSYLKNINKFFKNNFK